MDETWKEKGMKDRFSSFYTLFRSTRTHYLHTFNAIASTPSNNVHIFLGQNQRTETSMVPANSLGY
jgi:hypothetical protein